MKKNFTQILEILEATYGHYGCGLNFRSPFELLVATILSAQCTDVRVNIVTEDLYKEYNTPEKILELGETGLLEKIKTCGLSKTKAKNIIKTCRVLCDQYGGEVPQGMDELTALFGVGRKTANVVRSNAFHIPAIAVDTHVQRVSNRLGLAQSKDVLKTEQQLMKNIPKEKWSAAHHWLIWHGRTVCSARNPKCAACPLLECCAHPAASPEAE